MDGSKLLSRLFTIDLLVQGMSVSVGFEKDMMKIRTSYKSDPWSEEEEEYINKKWGRGEFD